MEPLAMLSHIAHREIGIFPTPLHPLHRLEADLGHKQILIKRDDLNGIGPGGNKIRSLEYLLAEALCAGCDTVFASGPLQSNLCTLTAASCAKLGLACVLVLNASKPDRPNGNLLLNELFGVEVHYLGDVSAAQREQAVAQLAAQCSLAGGRPYVIQNGATTGLGALGYVRAIPELMAQCAQMGLEQLSIYAPAGNGGVAAGLALGNWLAGSPFKIIVVSVEYEHSKACANITNVMRDSAALLGCPPPPALHTLCRVTAEFRGDGWGCNTPDSAQAVLRLARAEGILIENIYNSKVLVAMEHELRSGIVSGNVCFLHTGGLGSLPSQYP